MLTRAAQQSTQRISGRSGILTATFARADRTVVGIDPSPNMVAYATNRANGQSVRWILGDSRDIPAKPFDYAVMTGNVAQHIGGSDWERTLTDISGTLRDGGVLASESRNPQARAWEKWPPQSQPFATPRTVHFGNGLKPAKQNPAGSH